eukprot:1152238-Pelagomonas_calceolata.AAC.2
MKAAFGLAWAFRPESAWNTASSRVVHAVYIGSARQVPGRPNHRRLPSKCQAGLTTGGVSRAASTTFLRKHNTVFKASPRQCFSMPGGGRCAATAWAQHTP